MKSKLIAVGERAPRWVAEGFGEYQKRLSHWLPLELVEIEPGLRGKGRDAVRATADEGARVLAALPKNACVVALEGRGRLWTSEQLAQRLEHWRGQGRDLAFLIGGPEGHAVVSGDLDDWPFNHNNGLFHAGGKLRAATVKFQPDWPAVEALDADIAFVGDGFSVEGGGKIAGVGVRKVQAGIESYHDGVLYVKADTSSEAGQLLNLLRQSPLHKEHADTLDNLRASGPAAVAFDMPAKAGIQGFIATRLHRFDPRIRPHSPRPHRSQQRRPPLNRPPACQRHAPAAVPSE